jgi:hypothetical protein
VIGKLQLIAGLVAVVLLAGAGLWIKALRADRAALEATIAERNSDLEIANGVIGRQVQALAVKDVKSRLDEVKVLINDGAAVTAGSLAAALAKPLNSPSRSNRDASYDGIAAGVLVDDFRVLQRIGKRLDALQACPTGDGACVSAVRDSGDPPDDTLPGLKQPFYQSDFGKACKAVALTVTQYASDMMGVKMWKFSTNAEIDKSNAAAAAIGVGR